MKIKRNSRLSKSSWNTNYAKTQVSFWDTDFDLTIEPKDDDVYYQVKQNDRLDLIAARFYGSRPELWWIIAKANKMMLGLADFRIGMFLRVPSPDYVLNTVMR